MITVGVAKGDARRMAFGARLTHGIRKASLGEQQCAELRGCGAGGGHMVGTTKHSERHPRDRHPAQQGHRSAAPGAAGVGATATAVAVVIGTLNRSLITGTVAAVASQGSGVTPSIASTVLT